MATDSKPNEYMSKVPELRKKFLDKHYSSSTNYYDSRDISRVKSDDQFVLQFLNGREGNIDKAHKAMIEGLKWRKSFGINDLTEKDIDVEVLKSGILFIQGKDKKGATMIFNVGAKFVWKGNKEKTAAYQKLFALMFEKHQRERPDEKLTIVTECEGSGLSNVDVDNSKFVVHLMMNCYPDIIENSIILNFPTIFKAIWKVTKALLSASLVKRYIFPNKEEVSQYIDMEQLPIQFGGDNKFEYKYPPEEKTTSDSNSNVATEVV